MRNSIDDFSRNSMQYSSLNSLQDFSPGISIAIPSSHAVSNWSLPEIFPGVLFGVPRCMSEFHSGFLKKFIPTLHPGVFAGLLRECLAGFSGVSFRNFDTCS